MHRAAVALIAVTACAGPKAPVRSADPRPVSACDGRPLGEREMEPLTYSSEPEWGMRVVSVEIDGLSRVPATLAKSVIRTRVGARLDESELGRDMVALDELEAFDQVSVETESIVSGVRVHFVVSERDKVGRVEYRGLGDLPNGRWVRVSSGELYDASRIGRSARDLKLRLRDEGYVDAEVDARRLSAENGRVDVCLRVTKGRKVVLGALEFSGNEHATDTELLARLDRYAGNANRVGAPYRSDLLAEDRYRLLALYYDRGFVEVKVGEPRVEIGDAVRVEIPIHEGPMYRVGPVRIDPAAAPLFGVKRGDVFNRTKVAEGVARIQTTLGREVTLEHKPDEKRREIGLVLKLARPK